MAYFVVFAILFALASVNSAQMELQKRPLKPFPNTFGSLPAPNGGGLGQLPGGPIGGISDGELELQKIRAEGCQGMSHFVMGRQMRQSCSTYCGSSFMRGNCYGGICNCTPR